MPIKVEGIEDALRVFDKQPENTEKVLKTAMRAGAKAGAQELKKALPARFKALAKGKVGVDARKNYWAGVGVYNNQRAQGHQPAAYRTGKARKGIVDWFKFYWQDYGTLTLRDQSHHFTRPVRGNVRTRRNNVGIAPRKVFDRTVESSARRFQEAMEDSIEKQKDKLLER